MTEVLGDGTNSTFALSGTGAGVEERFTGFGRVPPLQDLPDGLYGDIVTVIIRVVRTPADSGPGLTRLFKSRHRTFAPWEQP